MSKEAPIICDYLPRKNSFASSSNLSVNNPLPVSPEPILKKYIRSWEEMKGQIEEESCDRKKLDMDVEQLEGEIDMLQSEGVNILNTDTGKKVIFVDIFHEPKISFTKDLMPADNVMPSNVAMIMLENLSFLSHQRYMSSKTGHFFRGRETVVRGDDLKEALNNLGTIPDKDDLKESINIGEIVPKNVQSEPAANIDLGTRKELTEEGKKILKIVRDETKEILREEADRLLNGDYISYKN
jgi:hypothetical protein